MKEASGSKFYVVVQESVNSPERFYAPYSWAKNCATDNPLMAASYDSLKDANDVKNTIIQTSTKLARIVGAEVNIKFRTEIKTNG
jgi:hypothetical protein